MDLWEAQGELYVAASVALAVFAPHSLRPEVDLEDASGGRLQFSVEDHDAVLVEVEVFEAGSILLDHSSDGCGHEGSYGLVAEFGPILDDPLDFLDHLGW